VLRLRTRLEPTARENPQRSALLVKHGRGFGLSAFEQMQCVAETALPHERIHGRHGSQLAFE
jgi:hypothetical protein